MALLGAPELRTLNALIRGSTDTDCLNRTLQNLRDLSDPDKADQAREDLRKLITRLLGAEAVQVNGSGKKILELAGGTGVLTGALRTQVGILVRMIGEKLDELPPALVYLPDEPTPGAYFLIRFDKRIRKKMATDDDWKVALGVVMEKDKNSDNLGFFLTLVEVYMMEMKTNKPPVLLTEDIISQLADDFLGLAPTDPKRLTGAARGLVKLQQPRYIPQILRMIDVLSGLQDLSPEFIAKGLSVLRMVNSPGCHPSAEHLATRLSQDNKAEKRYLAAGMEALGTLGLNVPSVIIMAERIADHEASGAKPTQPTMNFLRALVALGKLKVGPHLAPKLAQHFLARIDIQDGAHFVRAIVALGELGVGQKEAIELLSRIKNVDDIRTELGEAFRKLGLSFDR